MTKEYRQVICGKRRWQDVYVKVKSYHTIQKQSCHVRCRQLWPFTVQRERNGSLLQRQEYNCSSSCHLLWIHNFTSLLQTMRQHRMDNRDHTYAQTTEQTEPPRIIHRMTESPPILRYADNKNGIGLLHSPVLVSRYGTLQQCARFEGQRQCCVSRLGFSEAEEYHFWSYRWSTSWEQEYSQRTVRCGRCDSLS